MSKRRALDVNIRKSESFAGFTFRQRDLWHGLITIADDQGRMPANPIYIKSQVWPYDDIPPADVVEDLGVIEAAGNIVRYESNGKKYLQIVNWWKYQTGEWFGISEYPAPPGWTDRARYHSKGNLIVVLNWDKVGGYCNELPSPLPSGLPRRDVNDDGDDDVNDDDDNFPPPVGGDNGNHSPERLTVEQRKERTAQAIARGAGRNLDLQAAIEDCFHISPNWNTKSSREFLQWLKEVPEGQTVQKFSEWWYIHDWRGKTKQPPTLGQVRELWLQAFTDHRGLSEDVSRHKYSEWDDLGKR